jgi:N-methylhydantoinase A
VNLRMTALRRLPRLELKQHAAASRSVRERRVWFAETGFAACPVYWREALAGGASVAGPAIVEAVDATIVVPPGWMAAIDARGYIRMQRN